MAYTNNQDHLLVGTIDDGVVAGPEDITADLQAAIDDANEIAVGGVNASSVLRKRILIASGWKYVTDEIDIPYRNGIYISGMGGVGEFVGTNFHGVQTILEGRFSAADQSIFNIQGTGHTIENLSLWGARNADLYSTGTIEIVNGVVTVSGGTFPSTGAFATYYGADLQVADDRTYYDVASYNSGDGTLTLTDLTVNVAAGTSYTLRNSVPLAGFKFDHNGSTSVGSGKHTFRNMWFSRFKHGFYVSPLTDSNMDICSMHNMNFDDVRVPMFVAHSQGMQWDCQHWKIGGCERVWDFAGGGCLYARSISTTSDARLLRLRQYTGASGTHDGSSGASVLTDSGESWIIGEHVGRTINNTTDGSSGVVTANTATTITATLADGTDNDWDAGDAYSITDLGGIGRSNGQYNIRDYKKDTQGYLTLVECDRELLAEVLIDGAKLIGSDDHLGSGKNTQPSIGNIKAGVSLTLRNAIGLQPNSLTFDSTSAVSGRICRVAVHDCQVDDDVLTNAGVIDTDDANSTGEIHLSARDNFYESKQALSDFVGSVYDDEYS